MLVVVASDVGGQGVAVLEHRVDLPVGRVLAGLVVVERDVGRVVGVLEGEALGIDRRRQAARLLDGIQHRRVGGERELARLAEIAEQGHLDRRGRLGLHVDQVPVVQRRVARRVVAVAVQQVIVRWS